MCILWRSLGFVQWSFVSIGGTFSHGGSLGCFPFSLVRAVPEDTFRKVAIVAEYSEHRRKIILGDPRGHPLSADSDFPAVLVTTTVFMVQRQKRRVRFSAALALNLVTHAVVRQDCYSIGMVRVVAADYVASLTRAVNLTVRVAVKLRTRLMLATRLACGRALFEKHHGFL